MNGWHHRDITADAGGPRAAIGPMVAFPVGGSDPRVYYQDNPGHVHELAYFQRGWHHRDITADTGAPRAFKLTMVGFPVGGSDPRVYYQDNPGHVHELAYFQRGWHHRDITADTDAPLTTGALAGFPVSGSDPHVYYIDNDLRHVQQLAYFGGNWHHRDISADAEAPRAFNSSLAGFPIGGLHPRVYYRDLPGHVQELASLQGGWRRRDVSADTGAPPVQAGETLVAFEVGSSDPRVYYQDNGSNVHELAYFQGGWHHRDLGAPDLNPSLGSGFPVGGSDPRVYYQDNGNVHELAYFQGGWHHRDVTADTGAPRADNISALAGFPVGGSDPRVYYQDEAGHVHELAYFQDTPPEEEPPGEQTRTVNLQRQDIIEGAIPYSGRFPAFGVVPRGRLLQIRVRQVGFPNLALAFVKRGRSTAECGDPNAVIVLGEGQATTPPQLAEIYGVSQPEFSSTQPVFFVACLQQAGGPLPNFVPIDIRITID